jgi:ADP-heptose:LPS heptosyltransferase
MRILVNRQNALGDVILASPIVRKLKLDNPDSKIDVLTRFPEVFRNNPHVNVINPAIHNNYDRIINLDLVYENDPKKHITDAYADFVFGQHTFDKQPELFSSNSYQLDKFTGTDFIVIHMRKYGWPNRNLSEVFWQSVIRDLLTHTDYKIVQIGAPDEIAFSGNDRLVDHRGKFEIQYIKELINLSRAFIGIDTATLHIAACTNTPIISVFTSAHHDFRKPLREDETKFFPILPKEQNGDILACYGCQADIPPPNTGFHCRRNDVICTQSIRKEDIISSLLKLKN